MELEKMTLGQFSEYCYTHKCWQCEHKMFCDECLNILGGGAAIPQDWLFDFENKKIQPRTIYWQPYPKNEPPKRAVLICWKDGRVGRGILYQHPEHESDVIAWAELPEPYHD